MNNITTYLKLRISNTLLLLVFSSICLFYTNASEGKFLTENDSLQYVPNDNEYNIVIAALRGDYSVLEGLLEKGVSPNSTLEDGSTPLIYAAQSGSFRICKLLVAKGAIINYRPITGNTALIAAIRREYTQIAEFLIEKGANINLTDDLGRTAYIYGASIGDSAMCEKLIALKADLSAKDHSGTDALMASIINHRTKMALVLLNKGANVNTYDIYGISPLMVAVGNNDYETIELLLKYGADINHISKHKESALTIAIENNDETMLQYLVKKGADVNQKLTLAETPLTIARYHKKDNFIIETLEGLGAKQNALPDFRRITFGPEITANPDDFMGGLNLGSKEYKYNFDLTAGIIFRPFATRVLIQDTGNVYFQYWEKRNYVYLGLNKNFKLTKFETKSLWGITIGLKGLYTFGTYRGTVLKTGNNYLLAPEVGFFHNFRGIQMNLVYQYLNFGNTGVSPHRINFTEKFVLGSSSGFNVNSYRPWN
jgi:ankyrin repeat protein